MGSGGDLRAVDLFCGVGGLTAGLEKAGVKVLAGYDLDGDCAFPYESNTSAKFVEGDVSNLRAQDLQQVVAASAEGKWLLAGCAPCQPFSTYSRSARSGGRSVRGDWELVASFGDLVAEARPDYVTMENVPELAGHGVFSDLLARLAGYHVDYKVLECTDYGVPQTRSRLVLVASRWGPIAVPPPSKAATATVRKAIGNLPSLGAGEASSKDPVHRSSKLSELNLQRIRASVPGGTWRDWPIQLRAACHQKSTGETYPSVYGRMRWDEPSPTITTQCFGYGNGRFGHPEQDRAISLREAALLQTFPRSYRFVEKGQPVRFNKLGRLIGNAVPVKLAFHVGKALMRHHSQVQSGEIESESAPEQVAQGTLFLS